MNKLPGPAKPVKRSVPLDRIEDEDLIVYQVWSNGGGIDGLDHNDKPKIVFVSLNRKEAESKLNAWTNIKLAAFSTSELKKLKDQAENKIDGFEKWLIKTTF